jgi:hypothetical protein
MIIVGPGIASSTKLATIKVVKTLRSTGKLILIRSLGIERETITL